jgi:hypothetical protein
MAAIEVLPRRFIEVWQKAEYVSDVAQKLRLSKGACRMRAWRYKNHYGVPLKVLPTTRPAPVIDWDEMAELAASLLSDDEARRLAATRAWGSQCSPSMPCPCLAAHGPFARRIILVNHGPFSRSAESRTALTWPGGANALLHAAAAVVVAQSGGYRLRRLTPDPHRTTRRPGRSYRRKRSGYV